MNKEESNPGRYPVLAPDLHMYSHTSFLNIICSHEMQFCGTVIARHVQDPQHQKRVIFSSYLLSIMKSSVHWEMLLCRYPLVPHPG